MQFSSNKGCISGSNPKRLPFCHLDDEMPFSKTEPHNGVTIIVPVYDKLSPTQSTCQPRYCNTWQPGRILMEKQINKYL